MGNVRDPLLGASLLGDILHGGDEAAAWCWSEHSHHGPPVGKFRHDARRLAGGDHVRHSVDILAGTAWRMETARNLMVEYLPQRRSRRRQPMRQVKHLGIAIVAQDEGLGSGIAADDLRLNIE